MRKFKALLFTISILIISGSAALGQTDTLTILHVNDTHSHLLPYGPKDEQGVGTMGGIARIAYLVGATKMQEENVLFLHAGDFAVGDFMFNKFMGVPELQILKGLGIDALTLGNHEFDLMPATLLFILQSAGFPGLFPLLLANADFSGFPALAPFVKGYIVKEYGNTKVGIFGLLNEFANVESNPDPVVITDDSSAAKAMVDSLKANGANLIIALTHLGHLEDMVLAAKVPDIDIIVGGHSQVKIEQPIPVQNPVTGDTTYIVQAYEQYSYLGKLKVAVTGSDFEILDYNLIPVTDSVPEDSLTALTLSGLKVQVENTYGPVYTQVIAEASADHEKQLGEGAYKDTKLGNLLADALRNFTGTDLAFVANGFIRQKIWTGDLTEADIFQVLSIGFDTETGYGSKIATFKIDVPNVIAGMEFSVALIEYESTFFLQGSNISFSFNSQNTPGSRVDISSIKIGGQPILLTPDTLYTVTLNADLVSFLEYAGIDTVYDLQVLSDNEYVVARDFIVANSPIDWPGGERVYDTGWVGVKPPVAAGTMPEDMILMQNYPNPFNPSTTISLILPEDGNIKLSIYNLLGQEVKTLINGYKLAGSYSVSWDGTDNNGLSVASGFYFYQLKRGDRVITRKMTLIK